MLPDRIDLPRSGPLENPDEVPSKTDYYDGSMNLNVKKLSCKIFGNADECLHQSSCGWCGSNNACILGNNLGPLESCLRSSYIFTLPPSDPKNTVTQTKIVNAGGNGITFAIQNVPK